jgi:hypothetical protein
MMDDWNGRKRNIVLGSVVVAVAVEFDIGAFLCCMWNHGDCYYYSSADGFVSVVVIGE